tara:strand:- start:10344 stop:11246 length:903 start_codon:yes stop_codon:yes gene_type:complete
MNAKFQLVSVVIPCTDRTIGLEQCLNSVLLQNFLGEIEIVLVENNSTDRFVVSSLVKKLSNSRISHFYLENCVNANVARNYGVSSSKGEIIAFLDSDDTWLPNHVDESLKVIAAGNFAVYSGYLINNGFNRKLIDSRPFGANETACDFLFGVNPGYAQTSSFVLRRSVFDVCCWDDNLKRNQDYDFFITVSDNFKWIYKREITNIVNWPLGEVRTYSFEAFQVFYRKHKSKMGDKTKAGYLFEILRALSIMEKWQYDFFRAEIKSLRSNLGLLKRAQTYNYYLCKQINEIRFKVRRYIVK